MEGLVRSVITAFDGIDCGNGALAIFAADMDFALSWDAFMCIIEKFGWDIAVMEFNFEIIESAHDKHNA